jgi:hypothetical protein
MFEIRRRSHDARAKTERLTLNCNRQRTRTEFTALSYVLGDPKVTEIFSLMA